MSNAPEPQRINRRSRRRLLLAMLCAALPLLTGVGALAAAAPASAQTTLPWAAAATTSATTLPALTDPTLTWSANPSVAGHDVFADTVSPDASTAISTILQDSTGTAPTFNHPQPVASAEIDPGAIAVDPVNGDVAVATGSRLYLIVNAADEPATDFGLGSSGTLVQGDVYLVDGAGNAKFDNDSGAPLGYQDPQPAQVVATDVAFDPQGNLILAGTGQDQSGKTETAVQVIPATSATFYGQAMTAGIVSFIAGYDNGSALPSPAVGLPSAFSPGTIVASSGLVSDGAQNVIVDDSTDNVVDYLNLASSSQSLYGTVEAAGSTTEIAGGGTSTCTSGAQSFPATGSSGFPISGPTLYADPSGNLYVASDGLGCNWVLPATSGTLILDGAATPVSAGTAYKVAGNGNSLGADPPANGTAATSATVSDVAGVTEDPVGNLVFTINGGGGGAYNGIYVVANSSGTYYGQAMTAGDLYTIAGGPDNVLQEMQSPRSVAADSDGDLYFTDNQTNDLYELSGGPVIAITTAALPSGIVNASYSQTLQEAGGTGPYTWSVVSGSTAPLTLSSSGVLSGTLPSSPTTISFTAQVEDSSSSPNTVTQAFMINVNPVPASPPTVTAVAPNDGPLAGGESVTVTGTNFTGATGVSFGGTAATSFTVNSDTWITATEPSGTTAGPVDVEVTNSGGTSSTSSADTFTYLPLPVVSSLSVTSGPEVGGTTVTITGSGFTGATIVTFGGVPGANVTVNSDTSITVTTPNGSSFITGDSPAAEQVAVTTPGGTSTNDVDYTYLPTPTVTAISSSAGFKAGPESGGATVTLTGTGFTGATTVDFGTTAGTIVSVNSNTSLTVTSPATTVPQNDTYLTEDVTVIAPGGVSADTTADQFTYLVPPVIQAVQPSSGPLAGANNVTIACAKCLFGTVGSQTFAVSTVTFGGVSAASFSSAGGGVAGVTAVPVGVGSGQTVDVQVTTPGGTSPITVLDQYSFAPAPTVTGLSVARGSTAGGTSVTLTGTDLENATTVKFGTVAATNVTVNSDTSITATAPAQSTGTVDVEVTTPSGTSTANPPGDQFTYVTPPVLTGLSASSGSTAGGTTVTITGSGFTGTTAVDFGSTPASSFTVNSDSSITATAPAGSAGAVDVTVVVSGIGTSATSSADQFTYVAPTTAPSAPTGVSASAGDGQATVSWTAPSSNGGSAITGYTVTGTPGGSCTTTSTSCTITGLTNGTGYTFVVTATNAIGSTASAASNTVIPTAPASPGGGGGTTTPPAALKLTPTNDVLKPGVTSTTVVLQLKALKVGTKLKVELTEPKVKNPKTKSGKVGSSHVVRFATGKLPVGATKIRFYETVGKGKRAKLKLVKTETIHVSRKKK